MSKKVSTLEDLIEERLEELINKIRSSKSSNDDIIKAFIKYYPLGILSDLSIVYLYEENGKFSITLEREISEKEKDVISYIVSRHRSKLKNMKKGTLRKFLHHLSKIIEHVSTLSYNGNLIIDRLFSILENLKDIKAIVSASYSFKELLKKSEEEALEIAKAVSDFYKENYFKGKEASVIFAAIGNMLYKGGIEEIKKAINLGKKLGRGLMKQFFQVIATIDKANESNDKIIAVLNEVERIISKLERLYSFDSNKKISYTSLIYRFLRFYEVYIREKPTKINFDRIIDTINNVYFLANLFGGLSSRDPSSWGIKDILYAFNRNVFKKHTPFFFKLLNNYYFHDFLKGVIDVCEFLEDEDLIGKYLAVLSKILKNNELTEMREYFDDLNKLFSIIKKEGINVRTVKVETLYNLISSNAIDGVKLLAETSKREFRYGRGSRKKLVKSYM